jgi:two-component system chemotaxis response regulator CheY
MPRPTHALIVDDEAHVRAFLRLLLKELGVTHTWEAADGQAAIDLTVQHKPEVVLLDINLPVVSGLQALARIRALEPDIPVIMVTSQTAMSTVQEAARLGAAGYVLKHVPKPEALRSLAEAIDGLESADDEAAGDSEG